MQYSTICTAGAHLLNRRSFKRKGLAGAPSSDPDGHGSQRLLLLSVNNKFWASSDVEEQQTWTICRFQSTSDAAMLALKLYVCF